MSISFGAVLQGLCEDVESVEKKGRRGESRRGDARRGEASSCCCWRLWMFNGGCMRNVSSGKEIHVRTDWLQIGRGRFSLTPLSLAALVSQPLAATAPEQKFVSPLDSGCWDENCISVLRFYKNSINSTLTWSSSSVASSISLQIDALHTRTYAFHLQVDHFPITTYPEVCYSSYTYNHSNLSTIRMRVFKKKK